MKKAIPFLLLTAVTALLAPPAFAGDSMHCGRSIVRQGDPRALVRAKCGVPADVQNSTILRRPYYDVSGRYVYFGDGLVEVPVEVWTYNFGPYKLMRRVRFVDGRLDEIETLGYGYHEKQG